MSTVSPRSPGRFARARLWAEIGAATALAVLVWSTAGDAGWRPLWLWTEATSIGLIAPIRDLARVDPAGTGRDVLILLARLLAALAPAAILWLRAPRRRLVWLVPLAPGLPGFLTFSLVHGGAWWTWALLAAASATACVLLWRRVRWAWLLVALPPAMVLAPAVVHRTAPFLYGTEALAARCAANDGVRPRNLTDAHLCPGYYGVTAASDERFLLTFRDFGADCPPEAGSRWLRRDGSDLWLDARVDIDGSHFRGCRVADSLWFVSDGILSEVPIAPDNRTSRNVVIYPQHADWDSTDTACDADRGIVYLGEAAQGGLWTRTPDGAFFRRQFDAEGVFPMVRRDGRVVIASGHWLFTFDPETDRLLDRDASGIVTLGADLCARDDTVVVGDVAGRLRFFVPDGDGYRFDWGIAAGAPRFVAFSPDCRFVATGSVDDAAVWVVDRETRAVVRRFQVGPAIRGLAFAGPREVVSVDACTATLLAF